MNIKMPIANTTISLFFFLQALQVEVKSSNYQQQKKPKLCKTIYVNMHQIINARQKSELFFPCPPISSNVMHALLFNDYALIIKRTSSKALVGVVATFGQGSR